MRIVCFCTTFWDNPWQAERKRQTLILWRARVRKFLKPNYLFLSASTKLDAALNPIPDVPLISTGMPFTKPYDTNNWQYFLCAFESALRYSLALPRWDLLVCWEDDCFTGPKLPNFANLMAQFRVRSEEIAAPAWYGRPDFNFLVMKPHAAYRYLNQRLRPNLSESKEPLMLAEDELAEIFKGRWWNPWPKINKIRQEFGVVGFTPMPDAVALDWPFVALPSPVIRKLVH